MRLSAILLVVVIAAAEGCISRFPQITRVHNHAYATLIAVKPELTSTGAELRSFTGSIGQNGWYNRVCAEFWLPADTNAQYVFYQIEYSVGPDGSTKVEHLVEGRRQEQTDLYRNVLPVPDQETPPLTRKK